MVLPPRGHCRNDVLRSRGTVAVLFLKSLLRSSKRLLRLKRIGNVYGADDDDNDDLLFSHVERLYDDDYRNCHNYHNLKQSTQISWQFSFLLSIFLSLSLSFFLTLTPNN